MTQERAPRDRRQTPRMRPKGTAIVRLADEQFNARITNLSAGGMLVAFDGGLLPEHESGPIEIDLRLDGRASEWMRLGGRVVRREARAMAIAFDRVPTTFDALIRNELMASLENGQAPRIVVVDAESERREPIAAAFRAAGYEVVEVGSPLEAIVRVGESSYEPHVIAVADTLPASIANELRGYLGNAHPNTRIVTIGHSELGSPGGDWLHSHDAENDLKTRVRRLLGRRSEN